MIDFTCQQKHFEYLCGGAVFGWLWVVALEQFSVDALFWTVVGVQVGKFKNESATLSWTGRTFVDLACLWPCLLLSLLHTSWGVYCCSSVDMYIVILEIASGYFDNYLILHIDLRLLHIDHIDSLTRITKL